MNKQKLKHVSVCNDAIEITLGGKHTGAWSFHGPEQTYWRKELLDLLSDRDISRVALPKVAAANSSVVEFDELKLTSSRSLPLYDSVEADGVLVSSGEAVVLATGDCPTIIVYSPKLKKAVVAHAGRHSLIGSFRDIPGGAPEQGKFLPDSVVSQAILRLRAAGLSSTNDLLVHIALGIDGDSFDHPLDHPIYGEANERMLRRIRVEYMQNWRNCIVDAKRGAISLTALITEQFREHGVPLARISHDGFDTATDRLKSTNDFRWWSHRRGDKGRNLVIVHVL